tara:strand:+ start:306 stop:500 length:195 start_codon:yes stop_codon:yes gene_type:complete
MEFIAFIATLIITYLFTLNAAAAVGLTIFIFGVYYLWFVLNLSIGLIFLILLIIFIVGVALGKK